MTGVVGAVLAGGRSLRFGSDKAVAVAFGKPLIRHSIDALARVTPEVVVCGRDWPGELCLPDRPAPGLGPLSGLNAALHHARAHEVAWVLSLACDTPAIDPGLLRALAEGDRAQFVAGHPVIGLWPSSAADRLDDWLAVPGDRSMRRWAAAIGASPAFEGAEIPNLNHAHELADWIARGGS
jgi:molybdopterin-guanine dinucleotide biosynthesis protein A